MTEAIHPGHVAVNLHHQYATYRGLQLEKRGDAAELRERAKAAPLKVDAVQLRKQAKPLSEEAANAGAPPQARLCSSFCRRLRKHSRRSRLACPPNGRHGA